MTWATRLATDSFDPREEYRTFSAAAAGEGAIVTFAGLARPSSSEGREVVGLYLDHHPTMTRASLDAIAKSAAAKFDITRIHIVHRCGRIEPGEAIVFVAAAALHRRAAFDAADFVMDLLKTEAVFWKREDAVDASRWIEPTTGDHEDRARWSD